MSTKILSEILKKCKIKARGAKETEQKFLTRVLEGIDAAGDEVWETLSDAAQTWYNDAARATNDGMKIPPVPGGKSSKPSKGEDEDDEEEDDDEDEEEDDEDEDEDEDEEDEDQSIDIADAAKGEKYTITDDEENEHTGVLFFRSKTKVKLKVGRKEVVISRDSIESVVPAAAKRAAKKKVSKKVTKKKTSRRRGGGATERLNKREQVIDLCVQHPKLSEAKMKAKVNKTIDGVSDSMFNGAFKIARFVQARIAKHAEAGDE